MIYVAKKKSEGTKNLAWPKPLIAAFESAIIADGLNQRQKSVMLIASFLTYLRASPAERAASRALAASGLMQAKPWPEIIAQANAESLRAGHLIVDLESPVAADPAISQGHGSNPVSLPPSRRAKPKSSAGAG